MVLLCRCSLRPLSTSCKVAWDMNLCASTHRYVQKWDTIFSTMVLNTAKRWELMCPKEICHHLLCSQLMAASVWSSATLQSLKYYELLVGQDPRTCGLLLTYSDLLAIYSLLVQYCEPYQSLVWHGLVPLMEQIFQICSYWSKINCSFSRCKHFRKLIQSVEPFGSYSINSTPGLCQCFP